MKKTFAFILICSIHALLIGQNPHFSLLLDQPLFYNPAQIGQFNGSKRFQMAHRRQWPQLEAPYTTRLISAEIDGSKLAFGGFLLQDKTNGLGLDYLNGMIGAAGGFGKATGRLTLGLQLGFTNHSFDPQHFTFSNQYVAGIGFNPDSPTGENFIGNSKTAFSIRGGLNYRYQAQRIQRLELFEVGVSWSNLNQPELSFLASSHKLSIRNNLSIAAILRLNDRMRMHGKALWMKQQRMKAWVLSSSLEYEVDQEVFFEAGIGYRSQDAIFPFFRFTFNDFRLSFAYDVNVSAFSLATRHKGGAEVSLTYLIKKAAPLSNYKVRQEKLSQKNETQELKPIAGADSAIVNMADRDGDGIIDAQDACPDVPGLLAYRGCPDQDFDGLPDHLDRCPTEAGPRERAGCPVSDIDADGDGIPDKLDACPWLFGTVERNGCPQAIVKIEKAESGTNCGCEKLAKAVHLRHQYGPYEFEIDRSEIRPSYFAELSLLAREMNKNPQLELLVEGHTDAEGDVSYNQLLGKARAYAISQFLIARGIHPDRLVQVSYGELKPKSTNSTLFGKAKNRRVELYLYEK